ncbi:MAG: bacillithiol biosynthesis cysteine-adding enzyme BshC [Bacteroidota bacterium]
MQKSFLELSQTGIYSSLTLDYLNDEKSLHEFYNLRPEINSFEKAILEKKKENINRKVLVEVLNDQYKNIFTTDFEFNSNVKSNIDSLLNENTFTVTSGHQLNIFTGPLYFLYKIISTINLSEKLKQHYPHYNFVPVYWMASEDHDFEEINHIHLFGKKIAWNQNQKGACGKIATDSLITVIEELNASISGNANGKNILNLFEKAYLKNKSLSDATRFLVHHLFSKYGLVILDGDDRKLKAEFSEFMEDDLKNNSAFKKIMETNRKLEKKYKLQVNPREINLFYLQENSRKRIEKNNSRFTIHDSQLEFSEDEMLNELKNHPENFSPNVVLRPLYEEKILPNLAYVGGPGEISYWLEYKAMFDFHKINFPVLMLRNSALLIDENVSAKMNKLRVTFEDLMQQEDDLIKNFITKNSGEAISLQKEIKEIEHIFENIKQKAASSDPGLIISIDAEKQKTLNSFQNLETKLIRAEKKKQETSINQLKKSREKIFPENTFQERYENFIPYYLKYGDDFLTVLKNNFDPFDFRLVILTGI